MHLREHHVKGSLVKRRNPLKAVGIAAVALTLAALSACGSPETAGSDEVVTVKVGTLRGQPHLYQPYFYQANAVEGVEFEVIQFDSSPDITTAVTSGTVDFGITGVPSALSALAGGKDIKVVASAADGGSGFMGNDSISSIEDLVGKNVGYPQGSSQEILLRLTLENAGVDIDDLSLVNLPFSDMAKALESKRIDAFLSAELGPSTALAEGGHTIASPYETPVGKVNIAFITTSTLIEKNPDLVQKVVDTHKAAVKYMTAHPDEWAAGLVKDFGLDEAVVASAIDNIWLRSDLSQEYQDQVIALAEQMVEISVLPNAPTADEVFNTSFAP
ncbi:ABC transporter substrate-binding protein [Streptomyces massasporeus]|uniref:ABC transporter substrate-binding protein n=1 Tax=Streptomyces massasporeus TaxID=67324 RepID=UPI003686F48D